MTSQPQHRVRYHIHGLVQGVGFRPYIFRVARRLGVTGFIRNTPEGVHLEIEGTDERINRFWTEMMEHLPPAAEVTYAKREYIPLQGEEVFSIVESMQDGDKSAFISPDLALCDDCLRELMDPHDRRYRYPFINCTNCGPRLTIIRDVPYDRANTAMACFELCPSCRAEYEDPSNRRFHAEPNACPICGPHLWLADGYGVREKDVDFEPIAAAAKKIREGYIVAVKGLGGFHLAADATRNEAVERLRLRKCREEKPLAIMVRNIDVAAQVAEIGPWEQALLLSPRRPIVLCRKREGKIIAPSVAPGVPNVGIMLPYTPLHHLLLKETDTILIMTSANKVDEPICIGNREAIRRLQGIADFFLLHNRDILVRCDDSVETCVGKHPVIIRRSRGWAPKPIVLQRSFPAILALGGHLKSALCILKDNRAYMSPHVGDLETPEARDFLREVMQIMQRIASSQPEIITCDLHPAYWTSRLAETLPHREIVRVQHHHAHIVSAMAEHGIFSPVIGLSMDGTGYGTDGTAWGGEFLIADPARFRRAAHIATFPLPGAERAVKEPWRAAAGILYESFGEHWTEVASRLPLKEKRDYFPRLHVMMQGDFQSPKTSSLGRLFDAVAAMVGLRQIATFEGQAAMELEAAVTSGKDRGYPVDILDGEEPKVLDVRPLICAIVDDIRHGISISDMTYSFHFAIVRAFITVVEQLRGETGLNDAVLSGGCFQNRVLFEEMIATLERRNFNVYTNNLLPVNDGNIAFGQAIVAGSTLPAR